jgi:hypothetical protein
MHLFLTLVTDGGLLASAILSLGENLGTQGIEGYVGPTASLVGFGNNRNLLSLPGYEA